MAYLESVRNHFRLDHATGFIEIQAPSSSRFLLIFARGMPVGTYEISSETCQRVSWGEIVESFGESVLPISTVSLPDTAGRAVWLVLESAPRHRFEMRSTNDWDVFLAMCQAEKFTGQIQIRSPEHDGFLFLYRGAPVSSESIFSSWQGFHSNWLRIRQSSTVCDVTIFDPVQTSLAYQSTLLRLGLGRWGGELFERYQELAGTRLLQNLIQQVALFIQPWNWEVRLIGNSILDRHFFPALGKMIEAYREIFMVIGGQMEIVLGGPLTRRLWEETYRQLWKEERAALEAQRLVPAAFTT